MKNGIIILAILFSGLALNAQSDSKSGKTYTLKGKLVNGFDTINIVCGRYAFATVVEFEIINFSDSEYTRQRIPIIFTCPNPNNYKKYIVGKTYELVITKKNSVDFTWTLMESREAILKTYNLNMNYFFEYLKK